ncbi:DUF6356 family protein [Yoonia sp. SS1-5]|uniref:DUF6356 family protein n=1 Tax=Yoonia rhodophyticola TaxID=3137370 RepID=A0AAN0NJQ8_9RHOB
MSDVSRPAARNNPLIAIFCDHPATVNESYLGHMRFALSFAFWLGMATVAALIHALVPALCETTASRILKRLHAKIAQRH